VFVVQLNLFHFEAATPVRLVPQTILKRAARVLLGDEEFYCFRVVKFGERIQAHGQSLIRWERGNQALPSALSCLLIRKARPLLGEERQ
jgi:hypothetical protein